MRSRHLERRGHRDPAPGIEPEVRRLPTGLRRPLILFAAVVSAVGGSACSSHTPGSCTTDADCRDGRLCLGDVCVHPCNTPTDCSSGQTCIAGVCVQSECALDAGCVDPGPCELLAGADCNSGRCSYLSRTCDLAPSPHCLADDATYRTYAPVGVCNGFTGLCEYVPLDTPCQGCTLSCLTQCSQVTCPPIADGCRLGSCVAQGVVSCQYSDATDGAACTPSTGALAGVCFAGACVECLDATNCDDGVECTVDACDSSNQCVATPVTDLASCLLNDGGTGTCIAGVCSPSNTCTDGYCLADDGEACAVNSDCVNACISFICGPTSPNGGTCDEVADCTTASTCTANVCLGDDGQVCTVNGDCLNICISFICGPTSPNGGTCDEVADCTTATTCGGSVCLGDDGQTCSVNGDCLNTCISFSCGPTSPNGGTCDEVADCTTATTCTGSVCLTPVTGSVVTTGGCNISNTSTSISCTIIPALNYTTNTMMVFQASGSDTTPNTSNVRCYLVDATSITCDRVGTSGVVNIAWQTTEFATGVNVQHLTTGCTGQTTNVLVDSVDTSKTFVLYSTRQGGAVQDMDDLRTVRLTSQTNVEIRLTDIACTSAISEGALQVIEYAGASVTRGLTGSLGGTSLAVTALAAVDPAKTMLLYSYRGAPAENAAAILVRGNMDSTTSLLFSRGDSTGPIEAIAWERIEFTDATTAHQLPSNMAAGTATVNVTIPTAVVLSRTIAFAGGQWTAGQGLGETSFATSSILGTAIGRHQLTTTTNLLVTRDDTNGSAAWTSYVVEFPP